MPKKIIRNLQVGVGFSLLILIASSVASYLSIQNQLENREKLSASRRSITAVKDVLVALLDAETGNRGYQLTGRESFLQPFNKSLEELPKAIERAKALNIDNKNQLDRLDKLEQNVKDNINNIKIFVENRRKGIVMTQQQFLMSKSYMDRCRMIVNDFVRNEEKQLEIKNKDLTKSSNNTVLFIILSAIAAVIVTAFFYAKMRADLIRRDKLEKELKAKDLEITRRVNAIKEIANKVASGDYSQKATDNSQDDLGDLVESLNHMTDSLKKSFDKINDSEWRQTGLVLLNESLVGNKSLKDVSNESLKHFIEYTNCINGALYLNDDGRLKLKAAYGLEDRMKKIFDSGEGMVGQVFLEKKIKVFNNINDSDFAVSFASSKVQVNSILLLPIVSGDHNFGVIELSSTENFSDQKLEYFAEGSRNIAVAIGAAKSREQEQRLLEETQTQSEELMVQHSELENLNTELEA